MKLAFGIMFGVLTAAAIASGIVFYISERSAYENLVEERVSLEKDIALLESELHDWQKRMKNPGIMSAQMDSLLDALDLREEEIRQALGGTLPVNLVSFNLSRLDDENQWSSYDFGLMVESAPDSIFTSLASGLPLIKFDRITGEMHRRGFDLDITGTIRIPFDDQ